MIDSGIPGIGENITLPRGQLTVITGSTGSGKSHIAAYIARQVTQLAGSSNNGVRVLSVGGTIERTLRGAPNIARVSGSVSTVIDAMRGRVMDLILIDDFDHMETSTTPFHTASELVFNMRQLSRPPAILVTVQSPRRPQKFWGNSPLRKIGSMCLDITPGVLQAHTKESPEEVTYIPFRVEGPGDPSVHWGTPTTKLRQRLSVWDRILQD